MSFQDQNSRQEGPSMNSKIYGMLIGSAIGDAAGGPVEFVHPPLRSHWSTCDQKISREGIEELGKLFKLRPYPKDVEPFAQWEAFGPEGTITDDTRFKMILFSTLKNFDGALTMENFAQSVLDFREELPEDYRDNYDRWIPEIAYATNWALGERENSFPTERIWGGIPTMEGQMPFLPIAALNPENPEWCYLKSYELGYFDIGIAKDINSALVAGLAWVPVVVVMACAEIVDYDPLASMQLMIEFGHDTDSYAQVMGAVMGAIHGSEIWSEEMRDTVNHRMKEQFNQNVDDWMLLIHKYES